MIRFVFISSVVVFGVSVIVGIICCVVELVRGEEGEE